MKIRPEAIYLICLGAFLGIAIYKILDPPSINVEELVKAIEEGPWAQRLAEFYVGAKAPKEVREAIARYLAERIAEKAVSA